MLVLNDWSKILDPGPFGVRFLSRMVSDGTYLYIIAGKYESGGTEYAYNDVWRSSDGISWTQIQASAPWSARGAHCLSYFNGKLWIMGGSSAYAAAWYNDVWSSPDGISWTQEIASAPWQARHEFTVTVHNGKMYLIGGYLSTYAMASDVWETPDGVAWAHVGNINTSRREHVAISFKSKLWVYGGDSGSFENDMQSSPDGITWTPHGNAAWPARKEAAIAYNSIDDEIVLFAGIVTGVGYDNDVWKSTDGTTWSEVTQINPFVARSDFCIAELGGSIYLGTGRSISTLADVWKAVFTDPVAEFSATPRSGIKSFEVQFTDESIGSNITDWLWDFGDGDTSTEQNPVHTYTSDLDYYKYFSPSLLITAPWATNQITKTNYILVKPREIGALRFTALNLEDVSQRKVSIVQNTDLATAAEIVWTLTSLEITVNNTHTDPISEIMSPASVTGTPWATIRNISPKDYKVAPVFGPTDFEDLYNYVSYQEASGRYYPSSGKVWKWFEGYSVADGDTIGDLTAGEWVDSKAKFKYMIEVEGSLEYLGSEAFTIYMTTGRSYDIAKEVINLPYMTSGIEIEGIYFEKDKDYSFVDQIVEFGRDIFVEENVSDDDILYCKKAPIIENYLFEQHGGMLGVSDWTQYNYRNISGKAALNTLQSSLRNASSLIEYEKALNVYYGLPVAPEKCKVVGLFESYGYKVIGLAGLTILLEIKSGEELHPFIQPNCTLIDDSGNQFIITGISSDRTLGRVTLDTISNLNYGDRLNVKLNNKFKLKNVYAETSSAAAYIDVYIREGAVPIKHVIDTVYGIYGRYPEILIYGTDKFETNYDGLYHATNAVAHPAGDPELIRITLYKAAENEEPLYNDYIGTTTVDIKAGYAHLPWPTHKFLYLYMMDSDRMYRAYMDAPMDTIYADGDVLSQYQIICRNASVLNEELFPGWNQYRNFRRSPGINVASNIVEMIFADPSARFGEYFPNRYLEAE